ncbi:hypothetical protein K9J41_001922 [Listeria monocytogenes]|uniref:hypothetical protein n=1 Tax=Listeria monocytogenes TaxID=1639 RepID=UPI000775C8E8|nr:hypothetical protein [Listeria monocytogenes]EAF4498556.1 hypothetical protein [Listeria monocytogenes serotype 1/2a]EAF0223798.1 hypothetical protein [Listeria monocytogenes]EAK9422547.1 hypothetical protein [Listeria monocytogenes]EAK9489903.1 hypothetical protein [Listeria monocytogenes]ECJ9744262.1 hypothetical protein [Listeria monocytogenes]
MEFYKILKLGEKNSNDFYDFIDTYNCEYFRGNYSSSFVIKYNPETYNKLLNNYAVFEKFRTYFIQQLFVTNQKFLTLLKYNHLFKMKAVDCLFDESENHLDQLEEFSLETIEELVTRYNFNIKQVVYITNESKRSIVLQKNGVIGIDRGLTDGEQERVLQFIDTLNWGLKVIKNEKNNF